MLKTFMTVLLKKENNDGNFEPQYKMKKKKSIKIKSKGTVQKKYQNQDPS